MTEIPPIRQEVVVELDAQQAFELFTARISEWWPLSRLSVFGDGSSVAFQGGELVEAHGEQRAQWGRVIEWIPGERVSFSWHPGAPEEKPASRVSVVFRAETDGTRVILEHSGWEAYTDPEGRRREYDQGWPMVLELYAQAAAGQAEAPAYTWVALQHRPGPGAPAEGSVFEAPGFGQHVAFLERMREAGHLIAAGPMLDAAGEGMTILRLPGGDRFQEAERLATIEDLSVKSGLFTVSVRPWRVVMAL